MADRRTILMVEDAEEVRVAVADLLEAEGYDVQCAANGREALRQLEAMRDLPRLILLDLMMPVMDGFQFRAAQRSDARLAPIPVVLMTAGGDLSAKAAALGAAGYLQKPFRDIDTILQAVGGFF